MADVSQIKLPNGTSYTLKDEGALQLTGGNVTGPVNFGDSVSIDEATLGDLVVNGNVSFINARDVAINLVDNLDLFTSAPIDGDTYIASYADGKNVAHNGVNTYGRRPIAKLWEYIDNKINTAGYTKNTGTITSVKTTAGAHTTINITSGAVSFNVPTTAAHVGALASNGTAVAASTLAHKTLDSTTINNTAGTFAFSGSGEPWTGTDWVGIQVGDSVDKFQLTRTGTAPMFRYNDSGGTNSSNWSDWVTLYSTGNKPTAADIGIKFEYTTSGNNRAVLQDSSGNLYVTQKDDNSGGTVTKVTAGTGLSIGTTAGGNFTTTGTINHTNSVTAQTTQAVYPIKIDAQGHISAYGSAQTILTIGTGASNAAAGNHTHSYLPLSGGTLTGRLTTADPINQIITGSGTAASDKGSGVSPRYFPAKWTFNTGQTATNGDIITIKIPVAGHSYGIFLSIDNGSHYYPVVAGNGTGRLTTHYGNGTPIQLIFDSSGSAADMFALNGADTRATVTGGVWRVLNYYVDGNNYPQAYCSTAAATAAKAASMSGYVATANRYIMITMTTANSSATAITMNINSTGAKAIYINGSASSTSNYTLPAGSYLVFYDGTNYHFRTDGYAPMKVAAVAPTSATNYYPTFTTYTSGVGWISNLNTKTRFSILEGTASAVGKSELILGNNTASGTAGNVRGILSIYSQNTGWLSLYYTNTTTNSTITFPAVTGNVLVGSGTNISGKVTVSTSAPSGGADGDIWIVYTA